MTKGISSAMLTEDWSRRRILRTSATTLAGLTLGGPHLLSPTPAQAWSWVVLRPFLRELGIAIGASVIGSLITDYVIDPLFKTSNNIPDAEGKNGRDMLVTNGFSNFDDTPDVFGTAPVSGSERGAGAYREINDVIFGGLSEKSLNGCANFVTRADGKDSVNSVMVEGPTITGMRALASAYRSRISKDPRRIRDAIIPVEEIKPDLGKFEKSYRAEHRSRSGVISTSYRRDGGQAQGLVTVELRGEGRASPLRVNQEFDFDPELYKA